MSRTARYLLILCLSHLAVLAEASPSSNEALTVYQQAFRRHDLRVAQLAYQIHRISTQLKRQEQALAQLRQREQASAQALAAQSQVLARQAQWQSRLDQQTSLRWMLASDTQTLGRQLQDQRYLHQQQQQVLMQWWVLDRAWHQDQDRLSTEIHRQESLQQTAEQRGKALAAAKAVRQAFVDKLKQTLDESTLNSLQAENSGLGELMGELDEAPEVPEKRPVEVAHRPPPPFVKQRGRLAWPLKGKLLARFGSLRRTGQAWDGVYIQAGEGAEVRAVHPGRVVYADGLRGFGLLLIVEHDDGYMSLYGQNQQLAKQRGDWVEAGETLALAGAAAGDRLGGIYFGIRHQGKPLNPSKWCQGF